MRTPQDTILATVLNAQGPQPVENIVEEMPLADKDHPLWDAAIEEFIARTGHEPATDSDFEIGMQEIIQELEANQGENAPPGMSDNEFESRMGPGSSRPSANEMFDEYGMQQRSRMQGKDPRAASEEMRRMLVEKLLGGPDAIIPPGERDDTAEDVANRRVLIDRAGGDPVRSRRATNAYNNNALTKDPTESIIQLMLGGMK